MIPILYEKNEEYFTSNGLGRLRDCITCTVTEERNGVYECDFEYPVTGAHFDDILLGRIIGVTHDQSGDIQPFDIVSCSRSISGVVTFHAVHISYRLSHIVAGGTNIQSLQAAFNKFASLPYMPFTFSSDMASNTGFIAAFDGVPHSVKEILGGMDGSILDTFHGEYKWDKFNVALLSARGSAKDVTIRYGVNLLDYTEDLDYSEAYTRAAPYWMGDNVIVQGALIDSGDPSYNGRNDAVALDMTEKFETQPSQLELTAAAIEYMRSAKTNLPTQNITVNFAMLDDLTGNDNIGELSKCNLCDSVGVVFSRYNMNGRFKIVKTEFNVLMDRYDSMELGALSTTLSEALGVSAGSTVNTSIAKSGTYTQTSATGDIITMNTSNATLTTAQMVRRGNLIQLFIQFTNNAAISVPANGNITNITIGTMPAGLRPLTNYASIHSIGDGAGPAWAHVNGSTGVLQLAAMEGTGTARTVAAGSIFYLTGMFFVE